VITGLGAHDHAQPPPEYTSPQGSDNGSVRGRASSESERTPMLRRKSTPPPIPSYSDATAGDRQRDGTTSAVRTRERSQSHQPRVRDGSGSRTR
jgi:hypothetical protein